MTARSGLPGVLAALTLAIVGLSLALALSPQQTTEPPLTFPVGQAPWGVGFDGENVWVVNRAHGSNSTVNVIRASDGYYVMTPTVGPRPLFTAFDGTNMWVTNSDNDTVSVVRASDGFNVMIPTVGDNPRGIAYDGTNMWIANIDSGDVTILRASDGGFAASYPAGLGPWGLAYDGVNMWVTTEFSKTNVALPCVSMANLKHRYKPTVGPVMPEFAEGRPV